MEGTGSEGMCTEFGFKSPTRIRILTATFTLLTFALQPTRHPLSTPLTTTSVLPYIHTIIKKFLRDSLFGKQFLFRLIYKKKNIKQGYTLSFIGLGLRDIFQKDDLSGDWLYNYFFRF